MTGRRSQTGFSLVEAVIASMILLLAVVSVLAMASQSFRYLADIRLTARSSQVLQQQMENVRLLSWTALLASPTTFRDPDYTTNVYTGTMTMSDYDSYSGTTTAKRVTLTVTWTNRFAVVTTNTLTTVIANGGLNKYIF